MIFRSPLPGRPRAGSRTPSKWQFPQLGGSQERHRSEAVKREMPPIEMATAESEGCASRLRYASAMDEGEDVRAVPVDLCDGHGGVVKNAADVGFRSEVFELHR